MKTDKLIKVVEAIDGCEGYLILYPTVKKMHQVRAELQAVIDEEMKEEEVKNAS